MDRTPYGLVLAGGGAKGAYEMGAWKAMREMGIQFSAVVGVSIGALNGAMIAQDSFEEALYLWNNITIEQGINFSSELKSPENLFSVQNMPQIILELIRNGGMDITPLKKILEQYVDEDKVRGSGIDFGIITFDLSSLRPVKIFIDEIPEGKLIYFLLASARYPGLTNSSTDQKLYLDGGIYDNAPISPLRRRGHNRLVIVDISSIKGLGHKQTFYCSEMVYITPHNPEELGMAFDFRREMVEKRLHMGYLDAKKAFGQLSGQFYYFSPLEFRVMQSKYGYEACDELERLALQVSLPRIKIYTEDGFLKELSKLMFEKTTNRFDLVASIKSLYRRERTFSLAIEVLQSMLNS